MKEHKHFSCIISFVFSFFVACISFLFSSCGDTVEDMMDDYNKNFLLQQQLQQTQQGNTEDAPYNLSPGDEGFDEKMMLKEKYFADDMSLLQLAAPYRCTSYEWKLKSCEDEELEFFIYNLSLGMTATESIGVWTDRTYVLYLPEAGIMDGSYKLTLTVVGTDSKKYTDTATVVIYKMLERQ